jgi:hypothetical protein
MAIEDGVLVLFWLALLGVIVGHRQPGCPDQRQCQQVPEPAGGLRLPTPGPEWQCLCRA